MIAAGGVKGLAHITGGGITDNLPRIFPAGVAAAIRRGSWPVPPIFAFLGRGGDVPADDMYRTFNMGVGMIVACGPADAARLVETARAAGEPGAWQIGEIVAGDRTITYV
jgi:phosphoribosylformylglycinamidine cyclo-ligase